MSGQRPQAPDDIEQLQYQIDQTREQLADTVGALAARADVKARAREKAAHIRAQAARRVSPLVAMVRQRRVQVGTGAGAAALTLLAFFAWRKRA